MKINNLIVVLFVVFEVIVIVEKIRLLDKELWRVSVLLKILKSKGVNLFSDFYVIDLISKNGWELCCIFVYKIFEKIIINMDNKICDIYFMNGIVFKYYFLMKVIFV